MLLKEKNMSEQEVFDKIASLLADKFEVDKSTITKETSFTKDLDADSIDLVEFVLELEEEFGNEIPDDDAEKITTVGEAVTYIANNKK
ncbi:acyl carrier protein [Companilactobacillus versmoldensis DSM 14857 = KCTC 3814]|uniref:Acyl carrier protein n=2 Tax=Companilactobacillus versmoldensis TaxID=194326 RepID=A0A0R1SII7_9LACO|nr:acyl carrier protein [Companilactobacillus versmoldensis DSM 14857 = KCTC 3814]